ncbi:MAG TPA: hypothetical protein VM452_03640 [Caulifigura sp.]|nr:hypothetical protein [Caulifigura sp.]
MASMRAWYCVSLFGLIMSTGCRSNVYELLDVTGKVLTCDGRAAEGGTIIFTPIDDPAASGRPRGQPGREARGVVNADGTFKLTTFGKTAQPGVVSGRHQVSFEAPPTKRPVLTSGDKQALGPEGTKVREQEIAAMPVYPPLTCSTAVDPGEVTVNSPTDVFEFTLKKK